MKRPRTHQIDEEAQRVFRAAIPSQWAYNEQKTDYGKDYLVEPADDGELTGLNFFVQLKGQEKVKFSTDKQHVKFSLEKAHAAYYLDRVRDLPVFLVVVDVNAKRGWFLFLQLALDKDQSWRKQKSVTVYLPVENDLADTPRLRRAVELAKQRMRLLHPGAIEDVVAAHQERVQGIDSRFTARLAVLGDRPVFQLCPTEPVSGQIEFLKDNEEAQRKVQELLDRGGLVQFEPGEVRVTGTALLEPFEHTGGSLQFAVNLSGSVTLVGLDADGREVAPLNEVPGQYQGGLRETRFVGSLQNSPLEVEVGPLGSDRRASLRVNVALCKWEGQPLLHLAYFDRVFRFIGGWAAATAGRVEGFVNGNELFSGAVPWEVPAFVAPCREYLGQLEKARKVARHFGVNPVWGVEMFDRDSQENAEILHAILFEGQWTNPAPNATLRARCERRTFRFDTLEQAKEPGGVRLVSKCTFPLLGEKLEVGPLVQDYSYMSVRQAEEPSEGDGVGLVFTGTAATVLTLRQATEEDVRAGQALDG